MTSGIRLDEILADYFTQKDEKAREKVQEAETAPSVHQSGHHKRKHKKKNKKNKKLRNKEDEQSGHKRRSHSKEHKSKDKSSHKSRHKDKKHGRSKETPDSKVSEESNCPESEAKQKCGEDKTSDPLPSKEGVISESAVVQTECENVSLKPSESECNKNGTVNNNNSNNKTDEASTSIQDDNGTLEEGELVDDIQSGEPNDSTLPNSEMTVVKHKSKKKKKHDDRSPSSSPGTRHSRSSASRKSHHRHHRHHPSRSRSRSAERRDSKSFHESHSSSRKQRSWSPHDRTSKDSEKPIRDLRERIDKKRLLEIARKNVLEMIENGTLPQGLPVTNLQPQQLVSIKAGGKSVEELTEFCKALAEKHKGYSSSSSDDEHRGPPGSEDEDTPFLHHPFKVKEAQPMIRMNIRLQAQDGLHTSEKN